MGGEKKGFQLKGWQWAVIVGVIVIAYAIQEYGRAKDDEGVLANPVFAVGTIIHATGRYKKKPAVDYEYVPTGSPPCEGWTYTICTNTIKPSEELNGVKIGVIYDAFAPCNSVVLRSYDELVRFTTDSLARVLEVPNRYRCQG